MKEGKTMQRKISGFTLIEIAIVLVIVGLLLGGVLKGQELITGARVRNLISQQEGIKAAFFGFQDRFRALPGDYATADANISCSPACLDGNGNGRIESNSTGGFTHEEILAWNHLTAAGFLNGSYTTISGDASPSDTNTPKNPYSSYLEIIYDGTYGLSSTSPLKHNLKTGAQIPVEIIAEVDRKVDDGNPLTGAFQFSTYNGGTGTAPATNPNGCLTSSSASALWDIAGGNTNCGAASLF
jgi:prepilin-type N-terminal cleavage/methylation domain-containing protein